MARSAAVAMVLVVAGTALAGCLTQGQTSQPLTAASGVGFTRLAVPSGAYDLTGNFSRTLAKGALDILPGTIEVLKSDLDGIDLTVGVVRPDVPEGVRVPVIAIGSPYFLPLHTLGLDEPRGFYFENFVPHGYAVALVPVRGTADTGGCFDYMGTKERADLDQAITWLGEQPWSNGNVAMIGVSYVGSTPWEVAGEGNPHLKTIVPISGVSDLYALQYHNGSRETRSSPVGMGFNYQRYGFMQYSPLNGRSPEHTIQGALCPETAQMLEATTASYALGERDPLGFWAERNSRPRVEADYRGSVLLVQGLQDWNVDPSHAYPWVGALEAKGLVVKHLLGQWSHMAPDSAAGNNPHVRWDWAEKLLRWFDRWLKDDRTADLGPRAEVEDSEGKWRVEPTWPPRDAAEATFYLGERALAREPGKAGTAQLGPDPNDRSVLGTIPGNPAPLPGRPVSVDAPSNVACMTCASFKTEPFPKDFRFAGLPQAHLTVTPQGPGGWLSARLYVVGGASTVLVGWGQMDLRFAEGGETAKAVIPGQPLVARMELEPLDVLVPAGSALRLVVGQQPYGDHVSGAPLPVELAYGGEASVLRVHTFERGPEAFFVPPRQ